MRIEKECYVGERRSVGNKWRRQKSIRRWEMIPSVVNQIQRVMMIGIQHQKRHTGWGKREYDIVRDREKEYEGESEWESMKREILQKTVKKPHVHTEWEREAVHELTHVQSTMTNKRTLTLGYYTTLEDMCASGAVTVLSIIHAALVPFRRSTLTQLSTWNVTDIWWQGTDRQSMLQHEKKT